LTLDLRAPAKNHKGQRQAPTLDLTPHDLWAISVIMEDILAFLFIFSHLKSILNRFRNPGNPLISFGACRNPERRIP